MIFWNIDIEKKFFNEAIKNFASPEQLFYKLDDRYLAYAPKEKSTNGQTLQSRNSLIGQFTEKWCKDFFEPIATSIGLFAVNNVICPEIGLTTQSNADLAFCTTNDIRQKAENIKLLFEIKMSIVNNYQFDNGQINFIGSYETHKGNPSILRSDSMLKAIGKSINIRVSGIESAKIPIIIIGNSPITKHYCKKVDSLKKAGIIQSFISLYPDPNPKSNFNSIKYTKERGFQTFSDYQTLTDYIKGIVESHMNYFSSMLPKKELGQIITISAKEKDDIAKAEKFLSLINE